MVKLYMLEKLICKMIKAAGSGHYASSMSALEIMYPLFYEQKILPGQFILSKGHAAPALYAILYDLGYLDSIAGFRDSLPGHPELGVSGVIASSGSLGMGISKAIGLSIANPDKEYHVLVGDGECQEGQITEAFNTVNNYPNVHIHVDCNKHQYSGGLKTVSLPVRLAGSIHETKWLKDNSYLTKKAKPNICYAKELLKQMKKQDIYVLTADLEQDFGLTPIKEKYPERYIDCGIAEQNMVSIANGLALAGKIPICHTFSAFYRRAIDQMYNNSCDGLGIGYTAGLIKHTCNIGKSHAPTPRIIFETIGVKVTSDMEEFFNLIHKKGVMLEL